VPPKKTQKHDNHIRFPFEQQLSLSVSKTGVDPSYSPLPLASTYSSILAAMSVSLALYAREDHGLGDIIEVPLAAGLKESLVYNSMQVENVPERYKCVREREIERRIEENIPMDASYKASTLKKNHTY